MSNEQCKMTLTKCRLEPRNPDTLGYIEQGWVIRFPYDATFLEEFKDSIAQEAREWRSATKEWWVSADCWEVLGELFESWPQPRIKQTTRPERSKCKICGGSGLLPFTLPDGTISKHAKVFCECHDEYANANPLPLRPLDFDYGMSYSVYRSLCRQHGWQDPGSNYPDEPAKPKEQVIIHRTSSMSKQDWDLLQQTALRAIDSEKQLNEHMKPKKKPEPKYGYRGIR